MAKVKPNDPCICGKKKKYKHCCGAQEGIAPPRHPLDTPDGRKNIQRLLQMQKELSEPLRLTSRPHIHTVWNGRNVRAVGKQLVIGPADESFHTFLVNHLLHVLGRNWFDQEMSKPLAERHVILQWRRAEYEANVAVREKTGQRDGLVAVPLTGAILSLIALADDVYQLRHALTVPKKIVKRLRLMSEFQGARYEIAIASIFARCGFKVHFIDDKSKKQPEFVAEKDRIKIAVEAKSRHRAGVLHRSGPPKDSPSQILKLYEDALTHDPGDKPFMVFIDVNLPHSPGVAPFEKDWVKEAFRAYDERRKETSCDPDTALVLTNFGWHYASDDRPMRPEYVWVLNATPPHPLPKVIVDLIDKGLEQYGYIPDPEAHQRMVRSKYSDFSQE